MSPVAYLATYKPSYFKDVRRLPGEIREKLLLVVEHICRDPFSVPAKKLVGPSHLYRYRLGDYRLVYYIDTKGHKVVFLLIAHRREVYRRLARA